MNDYLKISLMERIGSCGTDLEIFLMAEKFKTDIFVYKMMNETGWNFQGFNDRHSVHDLTEQDILVEKIVVIFIYSNKTISWDLF